MNFFYQLDPLLYIVLKENRLPNEEVKRKVVFYKAKVQLRDIYMEDEKVTFKKEDFFLEEFKLNEKDNAHMLEVMAKWRKIALNSKYEVKIDKLDRFRPITIIFGIEWRELRYARFITSAFNTVGNSPIVNEFFKVSSKKSFSEISADE
jgi:hypothetical protein